MLFQAATLMALAAFARGHATFQELWINGVDQGSSCVRLPQSNSPVTSVTSDVGICLHSAAYRAHVLCRLGHRLQREPI